MENSSITRNILEEEGGWFKDYELIHWLVIAFCFLIVYAIYWLATYPTDDIEADMKARGLTPEQLLKEADTPAKLPTEEEIKELTPYTIEELAKYKTGPKLLVGIKGLVFDVSGKDVYMGGGGYSVFVGKDASCALARMNFDDDLMNPRKNHWKDKLNEKEMKILNDWVEYYAKRYKIVGRIAYDGVEVANKKDQ